MLSAKRNRWRIRAAAVGGLALGLLMAAVVLMSADVQAQASTLVAQSVPTVQPTPTEDAIVTALNKQKLDQEVKQLQRSNDRSWQAWFWSSGATLLSTLVVIGGALLGFWQWRVSQDNTRAIASQDRQDAQDKDLKDRKDGREKRAEERFQVVVEGLGSERMEAKVGAAITLRTFLQPGYKQFYRQAFDLAVAHLCLRKADASVPGSLSSPDQVLIVPKGSLLQKQQLPPPTPLDSLSQALITVFKESFPRARKGLQRSNAQFDPQQLDATDVRLDNAYLAGADLVQAWLVRASLREADLNMADLVGARLSGADLSGALLSKANLTGAILLRADLSGALLIKANLYGANLREANLTGANLSKANLTGAILNQADLTGADLSGVEGLTKEQRAAYNAQGALVDEEPESNISRESVSTSPPLEPEEVQPTSTQETLPTPDASQSNGMSSQTAPDQEPPGEAEKGDDVGRTPQKHCERDDRSPGK